MSKRKVIQISSIVTADTDYIKGGNSIYGLCNDGTLWKFNSGDSGWFKLPEIPQDKEN